MVRVFTRDVIIHSNLIFLSPSQFNPNSDSDNSNEYAVKIIYEGLCKFVHTDLFKFIIADSDVFNWNHRKIELDRFFPQVFYPFTVVDTQELGDLEDQCLNVSYNILIFGTEVLVPSEENIIKQALDKFDKLLKLVNLKTKFVNFAYKIEFEKKKIATKIDVFEPKNANFEPFSDDLGPLSCAYDQINKDFANRLSNIIMPFLLCPELDNYVGIYHRAPRILIYGEKHRNEFNKWVETLKFHLKFKFLPVSVSHIFSCFCGDSEKNLTFAFDLAKSEKNMPTIMVLDGIDLICRDNMYDSEVTDRLFTTLLLQLDHLNDPVFTSYTRSSVKSVACSDDCQILKWIGQCEHLNINVDIGKVQRANPVAVIGLTETPIDQLCQAVTRKGRFDFFI